MHTDDILLHTNTLSHTDDTLSHADDTLSHTDDTQSHADDTLLPTSICITVLQFPSPNISQQGAHCCNRFPWFSPDVWRVGPDEAAAHSVHISMGRRMWRQTQPTISMVVAETGPSCSYCMGRHWGQAIVRHKDQDTHLQRATLISVVGTSAMTGRNHRGFLSPDMDIQNCAGRGVAACCGLQLLLLLLE